MAREPADIWTDLDAVLTRASELQAEMNAASSPVEPPIEPPIEPPVEPPVEPPIEPPPIVGSSPIRRVPEGKHFFSVNDYSFSGPLAPFAAIKNLIYQAVYYNDARKGYAKYDNGRIFSKRIDHSDEGCQAHARYWVDFMLSRQDLLPDGQVKNLMWFDWESEEGSPHNHINMPKKVVDAGWQQGHKFSPYTTTYDPDVPLPAFLEEAVRWQGETCKYAKQLALAKGIKDLEIVGYNMPQRRNPPGTASFSPQLVIKPLLDNNRVGALIPTLYWTKRTDIDCTNLDKMMTWHINVLNGVKSAFGNSYKMMPVIWGRNQGFASNVVPAGWMTRLMNDLLDWGVDGFMLWRSSSDDDGAQSAAFAKVNQEIVDVIKKRGTFVLPT